MNVPIIDGLTLLKPFWGLVALGVLLFLAILAIVKKKRRPIVRERHTFLPKEVLSSARRKQMIVNGLAVATLLTLAATIAEPAMAVTTAKEQGTMCLILDKSLSMAATDVDPTRIDAVKAAATETVRNAPGELQLTVIAFASSEDVETVIEPSLNREEALTRINAIQLADGTALGEGIYAAINVVQSMEDSPLRSTQELAESDKPPVACVALSDGASVDGRPPFEAAQAAADLGIPIYTVAFGTNDGLIPVNGQLIAAKPDRDNLKQVAELTGGEFYEAVTTDQLEEIFSSITTRVATETNYQSVTWQISLVVLVLSAALIALKTLWFNRI